MKLRHSYFTHTNQVFNYAHGYEDSKELFEKNLKENPDHPCLLHYEKYPIEYRTNNHGFRSPSDIEEGFDGNVYLGCSHTFGIGHYFENIWVSKLNEKVGGKCLNLGVPGTGIGTGSRLLHDLLGIIKPKNIFCHYIHPYRYELFDWRTKQWRCYSPVIPNAALPEIPENMVRFYTEEQFARSYYRSHFALIKDIARKMGAKLFSVEYRHQNLLEGKYSSSINNPPVPFIARDMDHCNVLWHQNIADRFYEHYLNDTPPVEFPADEEIVIENNTLKRKLQEGNPKPLI